MSIAKILAPVTGGPRDAAVLANAVAAARPFNAHVVAFFVRPDLSETLAFFTDGVSGVVVEEVVKATQDAGDEAAKRIEAAIASCCSDAAIERVRQPVRADRVTLSVREVQGSFGDQLTTAARLADLIVFGPMREGDQAGSGGSLRSGPGRDRQAGAARDRTMRPRASRGASPSAGTARRPRRKR